MIVEKTWGHELIIVNKEYCGKILVIKKDHACSWHFHRVKDEVFFVNSGKVRVIYSEDDNLGKAQEVELAPRDVFAVPTGLRHRIVALEDSEIIEFSSHHEDSDSIRIEAGW